MGTSSASVSQHIATTQRILQASGLTFKMHGYGTGLEGEWKDVMATIEKVHEALHQEGVVRCATDVRIGTRTDKVGSLQAKIDSVNAILGGVESHGSEVGGKSEKSGEEVKEQDVAADEAQLLAQAQ